MYYDSYDIITDLVVLIVLILFKISSMYEMVCW